MTNGLFSGFYLLTPWSSKRFSPLLLITWQERVWSSLKGNLEMYHQQDTFFTPSFLLVLDCYKEIPQLWLPDRDDGAVAIPEERVCQGWIHQHLCSRQRNWASLRRRGQAAQQVLTALGRGSVSPFTDSSPRCLKIYFIIMLSGWHPNDFTYLSVLVRDKSASPWRKQKAALGWGVESLWNLNLRSG